MCLLCTSVSGAYIAGHLYAGIAVLDISMRLLDSQRGLPLKTKEKDEISGVKRVGSQEISCKEISCKKLKLYTVQRHESEWNP